MVKLLHTFSRGNFILHVNDTGAQLPVLQARSALKGHVFQPVGLPTGLEIWQWGAVAALIATPLLAKFSLTYSASQAGTWPCVMELVHGTTLSLHNIHGLILYCIRPRYPLCGIWLVDQSCIIYVAHGTKK